MMVIPVLVRRHLHIEMVPWVRSGCSGHFHQGSDQWCVHITRVADTVRVPSGRGICSSAVSTHSFTLHTSRVQCRIRWHRNLIRLPDHCDMYRKSRTLIGPLTVSATYSVNVASGYFSVLCLLLILKQAIVNECCWAFSRFVNWMRVYVYTFTGRLTSANVFACFFYSFIVSNKNMICIMVF